MKALIQIKNKQIVMMLIVIFVFSCTKHDKNYKIDVDFLINDEELESLHFDYSEQELELYKNDPDKVFYTPTGKEVEFSQKSNSFDSQSVQWFLNDKEWLGEDNLPISLPSFTYNFKVPGLYKVKLVVNNERIVTKFVRAVDQESYDSFINQKDKPLKIVPSTDSLQGELNKVVFNVDIENPNVWQAVLFEDVSNMEQEVKRRIWDFGDGTVIPTSGNKVRYSFSKAGLYNVKLCLNLSDKCVSKQILVNDKDELAKIRNSSKPKNNTSKSLSSSTNEKRDKEHDSQKKNKNSSNTEDEFKSSVDRKLPLKDRPDISEVKLASPSKSTVGKPARFIDLSSPAEAIEYRSWYLDGVTQNYHQKSVDMLFDKPGTYEIKMCLNYLSKYCVTKKIEVTGAQSKVIASSEPIVSESKTRKKQTKASTTVGFLNLPTDKLSPSPEFEPISPIKPDGSFFCQSYTKAGLKANFRCSVNKSYYKGTNIVYLTPRKDIELLSAKIYGNEIGFVDVIITNQDNSQVGILKRVQILPGQTSIEFAELALTLKKDQRYELLIKPLPQESKILRKLGLENAQECEVPSYEDKGLEIAYKDKIKILYDLKYCY